MQPQVRLQEERRTIRRTVVDALEVVRKLLGIDDIRARIEIAPLQLPSGKLTALVDVVFPELGCHVSLPTSDRFRALSGTSSQHTEFEISKLDSAEVCSNGRVLLSNGTRLRAVEVIPTRLPYEPSDLDERVLRHTISLLKAESYCYRSIREGLPEHLQHQVPELRRLDYSRVCTLDMREIKVIRAHIADNDPGLKLSNQKIADALAMFGARVPRHRPRTRSKCTPQRATI